MQAGREVGLYYGNKVNMDRKNDAIVSVMLNIGDKGTPQTRKEKRRNKIEINMILS